MPATEKIAQFIVDTGYENIPHDAVGKAKRTALDYVGAALAGVAEPVSQTITGYATKLGGPAQASVFGAGVKVSVADAAQVNGTIAHALDYDDCGVKIGHPSVLVLPAVLSLGEHIGASGQEILAAYIVGLEVEGKLALHADFKLMQARLNHQTWYGSIGAAAACAGFATITIKSALIAHPVLHHSAGGVTITGWVEVREERERSDRIVVKVERLESRHLNEAPERVRVSVRKGQAPPVGAFIEAERPSSSVKEIASSV